MTSKPNQNEPAARPGAIVTGATSPLGRVLARSFAGAGYFVGIHYFSQPDTAAALLDEIQTAGGSGIVLGADLTDAKRSAALVAEFRAAHGSLDVLVNNAGKSGRKVFLLVEPEEWKDMLLSNLGTPYAVTRAALRAMIAQRRGSVVNISSMSGIMGMAGQVHYSTAKSGLHGFTKSLAREVGRFGVRVNAIAAGAIDTPVVRDLPEEHKKWLESAASLQRIGTPEELASVALFLGSPASSFVSGQVIAVDGGIA